MGWLSDWEYRKKVTIKGETGAGTDYQTKLMVGESSGSVGDDFHVENHSTDFPSATGDGGDLRFTSSDEETLLDFWVEKIEGITPNRVATIWLEVSADLGTNKDIYCYYDKSGATNYSNGDDTFVFFDNFDDGSIDTDKWNTAAQVGAWSIDTGRMKGYDASISFSLPSKEEVLSGMSGWVIELIGEATAYHIGAILHKTDSVGAKDSGYLNFADLNANKISIYNEGVLSTGGSYSYAADTKYKAKHFYDGINLKSEYYLLDGTLCSQYSIADGTPPSNNYIGLRGRRSYAYFEDLFVRKFITTEPSFSSADSEEESVTQKTITSDATVKIVGITKTILSDAVVTASIQKEILSDANIKVIGEQKTITSDAKIIIRTQKTILSDAHIKATGIIKTILSNAKVAIQVLYDINNKFNSSIQTLYNINNKFNSAIRILSDVNNFINTCKSILSNINNKINTKKLTLNNIDNDVRFIRSWQVPGDAGFQSRGKEYIKVYIGGVEQTDVDVDSININKSLNSAHTAFFELGRAYDASKPAMEALVLIKYDNWTLYRGYIVSINPSDKPDTITINCNDEYWLKNRTKKYFFVGHKPTDNKEKYYNTIQTALSTECGFSVDVGNFVPQTINNFGVGEADTVSSLIQATGNYGFYYDVSGTKILWRAGEGSVIDLEAQSLGTNIGLYQIIVHKIRDTIEGLINKLRVQMGEKVIRSFNDEGGNRTYTGYRYRHFSVYLHADWYSRYEVLSKNSSTGYGWDNHKPEDDDLYKDVFKKYTIPYLDRTLSSWSDRRPPILEVYNPGGWWGGIYSGRPKTVLDEGFTIDYENRIVTLNEPQYLWRVDKYNRFISIRAPLLKLTLWKKDYYTHTEDPSDDPETDVSNPLMFFTDKMGSYSTTIMNDLDLSSLTIQEGGDYYDENNEFQHVPSWDDTEFAGDYADWQLSKTCDRKISGTINITLDAACFYNIDLRKRIMIDNVLTESCNITSIRYDISTFTVTLQIENSRNYKRTVSLSSRGE